MSKGNLFIISAPSGTGKTSLVQSLVKKMKYLKISISFTTRPKRPGEQDGVDYHFINEEQFQKQASEHAFLEYATVYGFHYGTGRDWVMDQLSKGIDVILEIDWQGARQIHASFPQVVTIFIVPPSLKSLEDRLEKRGQDDQAVIDARMAKVKDELVHYHEFDYLVINDEFEDALKDLEHIIRAERLKTTIQHHVNAKLLEALGQNI